MAKHLIKKYPLMMKPYEILLIHARATANLQQTTVISFLKRSMEIVIPSV